MLTFSLDIAPTGMTIDASSGLIQWTPDGTQLGDNAVAVRVVDGNGGIATQSYTITVSALANLPPSITSSPATTGTEDELYTYDVEATDPDSWRCADVQPGHCAGGHDASTPAAV